MSAGGMAWELFKLAAAVAGMVGALCALLWWLVWPRIDHRLKQLAETAAEHVDQLQPGGELRENAAAAAAAAQTSAAGQTELLRRLDLLEREGTAVSRAHTIQLQQLSMWREATERRLTVFEQALLALLGRELGARLLPDVPDPTHHPEETR